MRILRRPPVVVILSMSVLAIASLTVLLADGHDSTISRLEQGFRVAYAKDFEFVASEFIERGGAVDIWLVTVRPRTTGAQYIGFDCKMPMHGWTSRRHFIFVVGEQGAKRTHGLSARHDSISVNPTICLSDTVTVPVVLGRQYTNHKFIPRAEADKNQLKAREESVQRQSDGPPGPLQRAGLLIENEAEDWLGYLGSAQSSSLLRNLHRRPNLAAVFEAKRPGRFNLRVVVENTIRQPRDVPIVIVPADTPVDVLCPYESVYVKMPPRSGSRGGHYHRPDSWVLRVGDKLTFTYWEGEARKDLAEVEWPRMTVLKLPFEQSESIRSKK